MGEPRVRRRLKSQVVRYNQLWSSLDTLRQTDMAVESYARHSGEAGTGSHYLALYGLLQALVLQQDAVCHLQEALGEKNSGIVTDNRLQEIRTIRNWSVGHPTKVDRRDTLSHHKIKRAKLGRGFELVSAFDDGRRQFTFISIADLIRRQRLVLGRMLRRVVADLPNFDLSRPAMISRRNEHLYRPKKSAAEEAKTPQAKPAAAKKTANRPDRRQWVQPVTVERQRLTKAGAAIEARLHAPAKRASTEGIPRPILPQQAAAKSAAALRRARPTEAAGNQGARQRLMPSRTTRRAA